MKLLFLDTETTGLSADRHEIIEYAAILYENDQEVLRVEQKVKPLHISTAHARALQINGYSPEKWIEATTQEQAAKELSELLNIEDVIMVGHNPRFDLRFIKKAALKISP
jgi:DNA polymerase III epsilon subunit-like protein